jgi:hypothetical protein
METTSNQLKGRAIGALFFTGFGTIWLTLALYLRQSMNTIAMVVISVGLMVLLSAVFWLLSLAARFPKVEEDPARRKAFNRINAVQWIAIAIVAFSFGRLHIDAYVLSAITAIVGIHMFPLARLFRYPMHYLSGGLLTAWGGASAAIFPVDSLQSSTAIGTGAILWFSAATTLALALRLAHKPGSASKSGSASSVSRTILSL